MKAEISRNFKKKGVQVKFEQKPPAQYSEWLLREGFHYSKNLGYWYRKEYPGLFSKVTAVIPTELPDPEIKPSAMNTITVDKYTLTIPEAYYVWGTLMYKTKIRNLKHDQFFKQDILRSQLIKDLESKGLLGSRGRKNKETSRIGALIDKEFSPVDHHDKTRLLASFSTKNVPKSDPSPGLSVLFPGIPIKDLQYELDIGVDEEMEHTDDRAVARKIAYDHLKEDPKYYTKLSKAGLVHDDHGGGKLKLLKGREIKISMPNGEKRNGQFVIADLDEIKASHDEETFSSTPGYPTDKAGNNINDRNYKDDKSAQKAVMDYARDLEPERLITTSRTPSGTPIISEDGFVLSGNNRTMSLKLAASQYPDNYKEYIRYLAEEIEAYGFASHVSSSLLLGQPIPLPGSSFNEPKSVKFSHPILVRVDYDIKEYTTQELAKYNKDTKKSERPVDRAIKLSNILKENTRCADLIAQTTGEFDTFTEFHADTTAIKKLVDLLLKCNLLTDQELPSYFSGNVFTVAGKEFIENLLASLILDRDALLASEVPGVTGMKSKLITSLPVLMKNANLPEGSLINYINSAILLQQTIKASDSSFPDWIRQHKMFGEKYDRKTVYMNRLLNSSKFKFKTAINGYNESVLKGEGESLFVDKPSLDELFDFYIKGAIDDTEQSLIESSKIVVNPKNNNGKQNISFNIGDVVVNSRTKTVGIVRSKEEQSEVKTSADGNVEVTTLAMYDPIKHASYTIAPSEKEEIKNLLKAKGIDLVIPEPGYVEPKYSMTEFTESVRIVKPFMGGSQVNYLANLYRSEEKEAAIEIVERLRKVIEGMPGTYETGNTEPADKIVYLHYFKGGSDWYIVEKDRGAEGEKEPVKQYQSYGYTILNEDLINAEWGYIDIEAIKELNIELDFYWEPKKFSEVIEPKRRDSEPRETIEPEDTVEPEKSTGPEDDWLEFEFNPTNKEARALREALSDRGFEIPTQPEDQSPNELAVEYNEKLFRFFDNGGEFKIDSVNPPEYMGLVYFTENNVQKTIAELADGIRSEIDGYLKSQEGPSIVDEYESAKLSEDLINANYDNSFTLNKAIEKLLDDKWRDPLENWTIEEKEFISRYSGYGGLDEFGEISRGSLFEYFTPEAVIGKMWGLAHRYGYDGGAVLEPSVGVGAFFNQQFVPEHVRKVAFETNRYSAKIVLVLFPEVILNTNPHTGNEQESMYFEELFLKNNYTVRNKVDPAYSLVIGNPPYGSAQGKFMAMGEKSYTHAINYIDYFIFRGLDLLKPDGLLIYIVGAEVAAGGKPWLDQGNSKCKEAISKKADLIDAYRLPNGIFERTDVVSDIVVFRKKLKL